MACPECGAQRGHLFGCSHVAAQLRAPAAPAELTPPPEGETRRRLWVFPAAFAASALLVSTGPGAFIGRTCFGMWLHELGHALAAWVCGRWALPLPWFTWSFGRSWLVTLLLASCVGVLVWRARRVSSARMLWLSLALGLVSLGGHLLPAPSQEVFFIAAGDGGAMVLGALLATTFLLPATVKPLRGGLRWGWLVIGAMSWADATHLWVLARLDPANLPFGLEEGTASDATKLVEQFHWDERALVNLYLALAVVTLGAALVAWAVVFRRARPRGSTHVAAAAASARSRR